MFMLVKSFDQPSFHVRAVSHSFVLIKVSVRMIEIDTYNRVLYFIKTVSFLINNIVVY